MWVVSSGAGYKKAPVSEMHVLGWVFGTAQELGKANLSTHAPTVEILPPRRRYAYLVDQRGRVRWRGCGLPTERELGLLVHCAEELAQPG